MSKMKVYHDFFKPYIADEEFNAVHSLLSNNFYPGQVVLKFEDKFSQFFGARSCVAVKSGTLALHLALIALQIQDGDEVIVSDVVCEGVLNAIEQVNAKPVLIDIDAETANFNTTIIPNFITNKTKCIIAVHYGGVPCNIEEVMRIAEKYNLYVIEDCAQALGALYQNKLCGQFGDISIFSFYANKIITTGEGGAIIASNKIIKKIKSLVYSSNELLEEQDNGKYDTGLKYNYMMDDISALIGLAQLSRLSEILRLRKELYLKYLYSLIRNDTIIVPQCPASCTPSYYQFVIQFKYKYCLKKLLLTFSHFGIKVFPDFIPNHKRLYYKQRYNIVDKDFPVAHELMDKRICLPLYPTMCKTSIGYITEICKNIGSGDINLINY